MLCRIILRNKGPVSYTHLDVYKRQHANPSKSAGPAVCRSPALLFSGIAAAGKSVPAPSLQLVRDVNFLHPNLSIRDSVSYTHLVAERGRSLGIILFAAEQFKSNIHTRVTGNCSTFAFGRTNAIEIAKNDYSFIPSVYKSMMSRLKQGE